jgi:hypothetical protein
LEWPKARLGQHFAFALAETGAGIIAVLQAFQQGLHRQCQRGARQYFRILLTRAAQQGLGRSAQFEHDLP